MKLVNGMLKKGLSLVISPVSQYQEQALKDSAGPSPSVSQAPGHLGSLSVLLKQMPEEVGSG